MPIHQGCVPRFRFSMHTLPPLRVRYGPLLSNQRHGDVCTKVALVKFARHLRAHGETLPSTHAVGHAVLPLPTGTRLFLQMVA